MVATSNTQHTSTTSTSTTSTTTTTAATTTTTTTTTAATTAATVTASSLFFIFAPEMGHTITTRCTAVLVGVVAYFTSACVDLVMLAFRR